jgi:hypothetical protein
MANRAPKLFLGLFDIRIDQQEFGAQLTAFSENIHELRLRWESVPVLEPDTVTVMKVAD